MLISRQTGFSKLKSLHWTVSTEPFSLTSLHGPLRKHSLSIVIGTYLQPQYVHVFRKRLWYCAFRQHCLLTWLNNNLRGSSFGITAGSDLWSVPFEMGSVGMISSYIVISFMDVRHSNSINNLLQHFERLQYWYHWWKGFIKWAVEMDSDVMLYILSFIKIGQGHQKFLGKIHIEKQIRRNTSKMISYAYFCFIKIKELG
jgi:hypothetical protein